MQTKITTENYEEVMFKLLENEYSIEEREEILFDIERNPFFAFEWKQFQKSVYTEDIKSYEIQEVEFWKSLHQKEETKVIYFSQKSKNIFRIAASILLLISVYFIIPKESSEVKISNKFDTINLDNKPLVLKDKDITKDSISKQKLETKQYATGSYAHSKELIVEQPPVEEFIVDTAIQSKLPVLVYEETKEVYNISKPIVKRNAYKVTVSTENISVEEFALLEDYNIQNMSSNDENRINNYLKEKKTSLASLLKNTKLTFKKKDNKIYLLAYGEDNASMVWEIKN